MQVLDEVRFEMSSTSKAEIFSYDLNLEVLYWNGNSLGKHPLGIKGLREHDDKFSPNVGTIPSNFNPAHFAIDVAGKFFQKLHGERYVHHTVSERNYTPSKPVENPIDSDSGTLSIQGELVLKEG